MVDFNAPKWRFEERVKRLVDAYGQSRGITKEVAEEIVRNVILTKEKPQ